MAKKKGNVYGAVVLYEKTYKGTSIGRRPNTSSMNKNGSLGARYFNISSLERIIYLPLFLINTADFDQFT